MLGTVGVMGVGAAVVAGPGGGPNDYVGVVSKPPAAVYAALSQLGTEGVETTPTYKGGQMVQRIVKVANEQLKLELEVDGEMILSVEVQLAPEGSGTRIAAEFELNTDAIRKVMHEASNGEMALPILPMEEYLMDQMFAQAMAEMATRIEGGQPLLSLAEAQDRWGRTDADAGTFREMSRHMFVPPQHSTSPQMSTEPAIDPDAAVVRQSLRNDPNVDFGF